MSLTALAARFELQARYPHPLLLEQALDPRTRITPALTLISHHIKRALTIPDSRLILSMPPQEGKTQLTRTSVVWQMARNPDTRLLYGSYGMGLARKHGRWIRDQIEAHHTSLGIRPKYGHAATNDWGIQGHDGGVLSVGVGQGTGNPADVLIIDDPIKDREQADSKTYRDNVWEWWTDVLSARLAPGAPVILILTRWHEDDLAGRLLKHDADAGWHFLNIPARCDTNPERDPLGRQPGEYMLSARGRTTQQWDARRNTVGARTWQSLYQGNPTPPEGGMLKRTWWRHYTAPLWETQAQPDGTTRYYPIHMDETIISADLTFSDGESADYVAIGVWGRRANNIYLLDQYRDRADFTTTVREFKHLAQKWPTATLKLVENKANGPALISLLAQTVPGVVPVDPHSSKLNRARAWAPLLEAGQLHIPDSAVALFPVDEYVEEAAGFPYAPHDDQVDQTSQAADRLLLRPLTTDWNTTDDDDTPDDYRVGY